MKIELGGVTGVVAPIIGRQPPDASVWILAEEVAVFLKSEGVFYDGGPVWRIENAAPTWPAPSQLP